ncbi:MAG: hypothetical protein ACTSP4_13470, partial [Candidatus Hodarchaeales archaeon]
VNQFQTRTLSFAIDTLEKDMLSIRELIDSKLPDQVEPLPEDAETAQSIPEQPSRFSTILREQLTGVMDNIKQSLFEIKDAGEKETYKFRKGLEFDLKQVLRGVADLENFNITDFIDMDEIKKEIEKSERRRDIHGYQPLADDPDVEVLEKVQVPSIIADKKKKREQSEFVERKRTKQEFLSELENRLDELKTVGDYERFAGSLLESIGKQLKMDINLGSGRNADKRERKARQRLKKVQERSKKKSMNIKERKMQETSASAVDEIE